MEKVMTDTTEYQQRVLECIGSEEVDKFFLEQPCLRIFQKVAYVNKL